MLHQWFKLLLIPTLLLACTACHDPIKPISETSPLRISMENEPTTLDPRRVRDLGTATVIHMLYEGLVRTQADGSPALALAEEVMISPDQKTYTFQLRPSSWSNGQPV